MNRVISINNNKNTGNIEKYIRFLLDDVIEDNYEVTKDETGKYLILITKDFQRCPIKFGVWFYHKVSFIWVIYKHLNDYLPKDMVEVQVNEINVPNECVNINVNHSFSGDTYTINSVSLF